MQYLILGANGYIGSYLYKRMKKDTLDVIGTRHTSGDESELLSFDILKDDVADLTNQIIDSSKTAIFCIAQSNIDKCYSEYEKSYEINVIRTKEILRKLNSTGFKIIYFSSDNVFDGEEGNYTETDITIPINDYGKMKKEIEDYINREIPNACIFRLPKVISNSCENQNLLYEWDRAKEDSIIKCIKGNVISFISLTDLYNAILVAVKQNLKGLYNVSANEAISRKQLAEKFIISADKSINSVIECGIEEFPFKDKRRPLNVSMNNEKFCKATGYIFADIDTVIKKYLKGDEDGIY